MSRKYFQRMSEDESVKIIFSGYVTDGEGTRSYFESKGNISQSKELRSICWNQILRKWIAD